MKDAESGRLGYLLTGDEVYFRLFDDAAKSLTGVLGKVQEAQPLNFTLDSLQTIVTLVREKMTELRATIELRRNGDGAAASAMVKTGRGQKLMEDLGSVIGELEREQNEKLKADLRSADEAVEARTLIFLLAACGNILFLGWAYHRISQAIEESERLGICTALSNKRGAEALLTLATELLAARSISVQGTLGNVSSWMNTARGRPGPRGARFAPSLSAIQTRAINQTISL